MLACEPDGRRGDVRPYFDVGDWGGDGHVVFVLRGLLNPNAAWRCNSDAWDGSRVTTMRWWDVSGFNRDIGVGRVDNSLGQMHMGFNQDIGD